MANQRATFLGLTFVAAALASCAPPSSEVVVTIDTSLAVPCAVDGLTLDIDVGGALESRQIALTSADLPGSFAILATDDGSEATAAVTVTATLAGEAVARGRGSVALERGESKHLAFTIDDGCAPEAPCAAEVKGEFSGLPSAVARRDCVTGYEVRETLLTVLNACDLAQDIQASTLTASNELEVQSPLSPPMPFPFRFYNKLAASLWIGDNGYLTFGSGPPSATIADVGAARSLGEPGFPGPGVVAFWDQLVTNANGVCLAVTGASPDRILWVSWDQVCFEGVPNESCGDLDFASLTFSVGLEETTDRIYVGYPEMVATGAAAARARGLTSVIGVAAGEGSIKGCAAAECSSLGLCDSGEPCNYTEYSALTDIGEIPSLEFIPR